jgi:hypothetical protein
LAIKSIKFVGDCLLVTYERKLFYDIFDRQGKLMNRCYMQPIVNEMTVTEILDVIIVVAS